MRACSEFVCHEDKDAFLTITNVVVHAVQNLYKIVSRFISPLHSSATSDSDGEISSVLLWGGSHSIE